MMNTSEDPSSAKADGAYRTISEVADELDVPTHVLRFWESRFPQVKPQRMRGGRRYYRPGDVETLKKIKTLLYSQGYTIKGAKKHVKDKLFDVQAEAAQAPAKKTAAGKTVAAKDSAVSGKKSLPAELSALLTELKDLKSKLASFA